MRKSQRHYIQLMLFVLLLTGLPAFAQLDNSIPNDLNVRTGTLPNGFTY